MARLVERDPAPPGHVHPTTHPMIFVNLPVADLARSRAFFARLGYSFDERFCDGDALCLVLGGNLFAMLMRRDFFAAWTPHPVADPHRSSAALVALAARDRAAVDAVVDAALESGGREVRTPVAHGELMYARAYADPDGHIWELLWMDPSAAAG